MCQCSLSCNDERKKGNKKRNSIYPSIVYKESEKSKS